MSLLLPAPLQQKLVQLRRRILLARCLRGLSWLIIAMLAVQVVLFFASSLLGLEPPGYRLAALMLAGCGIGVFVVGWLLPLLRPLRLETLAAVIESKHCELGERLLSAVELSAMSAPAHGDPVLVAQIIADADRTGRSLDIRQAFSFGSCRRWLGLAGIGMVLSLAASLAFPAYAAFQRDLWGAWSLPPAAFVLEVTPGTRVVARDRPLTVACQLVPTWSRALPAACTLVLHEADGASRRLAMQPRPDGSFSFTLQKVPEAITYHVEAGSQTSAAFTLTGVEPVRLLAGSPAIQVTPPAYVNLAVHPVQQLTQVSHFSALEYSSMRFHFQLNRVPRTARFAYRSELDDRMPDVPVAIDWHASGLEGTARLLAAGKGRYAATLSLEDEHGIATEETLPGWTVWSDDPPTVLAPPQLALPTSSGLTVAPDEHLPVTIAVEDAVGLDRIEIEYRIGTGPTQTALLANGEGKVGLRRQVAFSLAGKVKERDEISWRLKVADQRRLLRGQAWNEAGLLLPERDLLPHIVYEPAPVDGKDRWQVLTINRRADPLLEQQVHAQRDDVNKKIDLLKLQLESERAQLQKAKLGLHGQAAPGAEQVRQIEQVRHKNQVNQEALRKFGWELAADPFLQLLADRPLALAEKELARSDKALSQAAAAQAGLEARAQRLDQADQELHKALQGLEQLRQANQDLAQDRLDVAKMAMLARRQDDLAHKVAENLPPEELARLKEEQERLAAELDRLAQRNKLFQDAMQQALAQEAQQLARQAEKMAQAQRELAQATQQALLAELKKKLGELAKKQDGLADRAAQLGGQARVPVTETIPRFDEARAAAASLREGLVEAALRDQQQTMVNLERLGAALGRGLLLGRGPREGALNLAGFQERLEKELERLAEEFARLSPEQLQQRLAALFQAEKTVEETLQRLPIPADLKQAQDQRAHARALAGQVAEAFRRDGLSALNKMKEVRQALDKLAQQIPADVMAADPRATPEEKLVHAQAARAGQLTREQKELRDEVLKLLAQVAGGTGGDSPLGGLSKKQEELKSQTDKLGMDLLKLAQHAGPPESKRSGAEAGRAAEDAARAMAQSKEKTSEGKTTEAERLADEAALKLEIAGKAAAQTAQQMQEAMPAKTPEAARRDQTGQALTQAQKQMGQAQQKLQAGQPQAAQPAMAKAAQSLQQAASKAAQQLMQTSRGDPDAATANNSKQGASAGGLPTSSLFAKELEKYGAKTWGELPGELRSRIVQDMRARYGEDYARIIQGYFQAIAEERK